MPVALNRFQRRQLARLRRADRWHFGRAGRAIERGAPLFVVFRCLRRGLIEALRAALFALGDRLAGGHTWPVLLARAAAALPLTAAERQALALLSAMPRRPEEPGHPETSDEAVRYLAICRPYEQAAQALHARAGQLAGPGIGLREGRWLRLSGGQTCLLLRWNGISALLGDACSQQPIAYFDLLRALSKNEFAWLDDEAEIAPWAARLVCVLPERGDDDDESNARSIDAERAAMTVMLECDIAGLFYHQAQEVAARLERDMRLALRREPDNPYDMEAVAVHLTSGEKLGYVPRRCNTAIARRLDAATPLAVWLSDIVLASDGKLVDLRIEIRSPDPADAQSGKPQRPAVSLMSRSGAPTSSTFSCLDQARWQFARGDLTAMYYKVDTACRFGRKAWLLQHDQIPDSGGAWRAIEDQFIAATRQSGLGMALQGLLHELTWRCALPASAERDTALALCLLHIELFWRQVLIDAETLDAGRVFAFRLDRARSTFDPPLPEEPLARRYPPLRQIEALRLLRRLLTVIRRCECGLPTSTAALRCLRHFNRDRTLVQNVIRRLAQMLREEVRELFRPDDNGVCAELSEDYLRLVPPLVTHTECWRLLCEAVALLEEEPPDATAMRLLIDQLFMLQPRTRRARHGRRRVVSDRPLYVAEHLLRAAESLDMLDVVHATCLLMPMDRRHRLRCDMLWQLFDALAAELFGRRRLSLLSDFPALLCTQPTLLDPALAVWRRATSSGDANAPSLAAARLVLIEALVGHRGRWPGDDASWCTALGDGEALRLV